MRIRPEAGNPGTPYKRRTHEVVCTSTPRPENAHISRGLRIRPKPENAYRPENAHKVPEMVTSLFGDDLHKTISFQYWST